MAKITIKKTEGGEIGYVVVGHGGSVLEMIAETGKAYDKTNKYWRKTEYYTCKCGDSVYEVKLKLDRDFSIECRDYNGFLTAQQLKENVGKYLGEITPEDEMNIKWESLEKIKKP